MKRVTQNSKVLECILMNGSISCMEAFSELGITRLSGRIFELRKSGYPIGMIWKTDRSGNRYGVYRMEV